MFIVGGKRWEWYFTRFFCLFSACVVGCWALSNEKHGERGTTHYSIWYSTKRGEGGWCGLVGILFCLLLFTFGRRKQNNAGVRHRFRRVSDSWAQKQDGGRPRGANTCRTFLFVVGIVFFFVSGQENQNLKMCVARRISCTILGFNKKASVCFFFLGKLERKELVAGDFLGFTGSVQRKERLEPNLGILWRLQRRGFVKIYRVK